MSDSQPDDDLFAELAWERFLRILTVVALVTTVFVFTASTVLPPQLTPIAVGAIGSVALVTAIIGFLIGAASTFEHAEERAEETGRRNTADQRAKETSQRNTARQRAEESAGEGGTDGETS